MARLIDVMHQGLDRVIGAWELEGVIVDPGPTPCLETLLAALDGERPRALLLTHIHLDHAGAAGALTRIYPELEVWVHEVGAPHLADPQRLLASARRLYGDRMEALWGEVAPVPSENLRTLAGGERIAGFRVEHTPGHASHHVAYLHEATGDAYVGDVAGVRIPPADETLVPTPPPDIDVEAWERSLDLVAGWKAARLCITHFGAVDDVEGQLERVRGGLRRAAALARGGDRARFIAAVEAEIESRADPGMGERLRLATPPDHMWLGLERYWRKREVLVER